MTPRSWPSHPPSSSLNLLDKLPSERLHLSKHTFLLRMSLLLLFNFFLLSFQVSSSFFPSSLPFVPTPAHWSLSVLNVRDTFKDAFRSPLIIHTAWIINNNSHRAIIQLYHHSLSLCLPSLSSSLYPLPALGHSSLLYLIPYLNSSHSVISLFAYSAQFFSLFMCIISSSFFPWQGTFHEVGWCFYNYGLWLILPHCRGTNCCVVSLWFPLCNMLRLLSLSGKLRPFL